MTLVFPRTIGRLSFAVRNVLLNVCVWPLIAFFDAGPDGNGTTNVFGVWALVVSVVAYWILFVALPRCRDAGLPWWILLLLLVPIVNLGVSLILLGSGTKPESYCATLPPPPPRLDSLS